MRRRHWDSNRVSEKLGVDRAYWYLMITGQRGLSPDMTGRIQRIFNYAAWDKLFRIDDGDGEDGV